MAQSGAPAFLRGGRGGLHAQAREALLSMIPAVNVWPAASASGFGDLIRPRWRSARPGPHSIGYRRLHILLRREGHRLNHKKLFRIYREERLTVRRRGGRKRALGMHAPMTLPRGPNQRWSVDFVSDGWLRHQNPTSNQRLVPCPSATYEFSWLGIPLDNSHNFSCNSIPAVR